MPKYGGVHYPNDKAESAQLQKGSVHVTDNNAKNKFGKTSHVPNGRDTFGDYTKRSVDDGGTGSNATRSVLNEYEESMWKYPKST